MRLYRLRFDIYVCLLLAALSGWLAGKAYDKAHDMKSEIQTKSIKEGEAGSIADSDIIKAESIEDILNNEKFTFTVDGVFYLNEPGGYHNSLYLRNFELKSGERVAVTINSDNIQYGRDYDVLPVGEVVKEDLTKDKEFMESINKDEEAQLTATDFYVNMGSNIDLNTSETEYNSYRGFAQCAAGIVVFCLTHFIGSKIGIFPAFFTKRKKEEKKSEWD